VNFIFNLISIISLIGVGYLIFLFYKKENQPTASVSSKSPHSRIKVLRFNPFNNVGGNQSFIICFLDENNCGCLITSLHNRDTTRIYAKEIISGAPVGKNLLSKEEKECLQKALNNS